MNRRGFDLLSTWGLGVLIAAVLLLSACAAPRQVSPPLPDPQPLPEQSAGAAQVTGPPEGEGEYGMLYFSGGQGTRIATELALNRLYESGVPGYGIYTFVLTAPGSLRPSAADQRRQRELLRLIETYAAGSGEEGSLRPDSHAFVVPVRPKRLDDPLAELVAPEIAGLMRREFAEFLRQRGQQQWANRLERAPGPFLVSAPEPRLVPLGPDMPRLVLDLSGMGPERLYELIDRYDQDLPAGLGGRPQGLQALRQRLGSLTHSQLGPQLWLIP